MRFEGIYTPIITPFHTDGSIDWNAYGDVIEWQIENDVAGVVIGGPPVNFTRYRKKSALRSSSLPQNRLTGELN
jgi:4-hydroxy-tetrahydrodipicolinate synthase